ncbi:MAG TPA: hypothetical protein VL981_14380 [Candidatus Methylacidiphilales bacterium]|nr:hypothetical protein [Candidatus Methylacidiphilales bacterium]
MDTGFCHIPVLAEATLLTNNITVLLRDFGHTDVKPERRRNEIAPLHRALENKPGNDDLAARMDAILAQATDAYSRYAPLR